jgi:hypothetical protein
MTQLNAFARAFFDPFGIWTRPASGPSRAGKPIDIEARASDAGMAIRREKDAVVLSGTAAGPEPVVDYFGVNPMAEYARSVSFTLDIDHAPTTDAFGNRDFSEKNSRIFQVTTSKGATAEQVADALAKKVNAEDDFRASVKPLADGSVRIEFQRR